MRTRALITLYAALSLLACGESSDDSGSGASGGTSGKGSGASGGASGNGGSGGAGASGGASGSGGSGGSLGSGGSSGSGQGLRVDGNKIVAPDGQPFHGRGANLHDTRSCMACAHLPADPEGLKRWADELLDGWGANFVRFDLEAYADDGGWRQQWRRLTDDAGYRADMENVVDHMTSKAGVYVMVTVFSDPSMKENLSGYDAEWPTADTIPIYEALAEMFHDNPKVLFALTNEPQGPEANNPELVERYLAAIDAIRAVEASHSAPEHIVVVQAPQGWARYLDWFIENPIQRSNVAYEVHAYVGQDELDRVLVQPHRTLPVLVGEHAVTPEFSESDVRALWELCKQQEIPYIAWTFHMRCPPNMLQDVTEDGCGHAPGYDFPRTEWGDMFHTELQTPW
jgi:hypothetical protein